MRREDEREGMVHGGRRDLQCTHTGGKRLAGISGCECAAYLEGRQLIVEQVVPGVGGWVSTSRPIHGISQPLHALPGVIEREATVSGANSPWDGHERENGAKEAVSIV